MTATNFNPANNFVKTKLRTAPSLPGVYWMCDGKGRVLYVGKAVSLRARLQKHVQSAGDRAQQIHRHFRRVKDINWLATITESEALALEQSLIQQYHPPFNVAQPQARFLCLSIGESFPRLFGVREMSQEPVCQYFGPYTDRAAFDRLFQSLLPVFRIRGDEESCSWDGKSRHTPCRRLEFGWCSGPCAGATTQEQYRADARRLQEFLQGSGEHVQDRLFVETSQRLAAIKAEKQELEHSLHRARSQMEVAAEELNYEAAARLRDQCSALERQCIGAGSRQHRVEKQITGLQRAAEVCRVVQPGLPDLDLWGVVCHEGIVGFAILPFRSGRLTLGLQAAGPLKVIVPGVRKHYRRPETRPPVIVVAEALPSKEDTVREENAGNISADVIWRDVLKRAVPLRDDATAIPVRRAAESASWAAAADLARLNARCACASLLSGNGRRAGSSAISR